ncbi:MAG: DUF3617 family protein [Anaeromyxobacter sp.]|nr:DUF3617 family protein [Anaeromyxobacter sp.]MBL0274590.1 DUF3617 family protein [Anaeromyxobacter sp.]
MTRSAARLTAALLGLLAAAPAPAAAERGVYWEQTIEMEMAGMPFAMPAQTMKVCLPVDQWKRPPESKPDDTCRIQDLKVTGSTMTWRLVCTGEEPMEGEGEMTYTSSSFTGRTAMRSRRGDMNLKMRGKKVGGDCDVRELEQKVAAMQQQGEEQRRRGEAQRDEAKQRMCASALEEVSPQAVAGRDPHCKDPAQVAAFCAKLKTAAGFQRVMQYEQLAKQMPGGMFPTPEEAAKACGTSLAALPKELCPGAEKRGELDFLAARCPVEAKALARRECAGRDYTSLRTSRYRDFCGRVAGDELDEGAGAARAAPEKKKEPKDKAVDEGKKLLKGVFGF